MSQVATVVQHDIRVDKVLVAVTVSPQSTNPQ
jgi:hypothetical protein